MAHLASLFIMNIDPSLHHESPAMAWNIGLNGVHRDIAADPAPSLYVLAGPGTGKTFAMTRRIARLLETGTPPNKILAVTFTRTAIRDLKEQLIRLGIAGAEQTRVVTLHSFCYSVLHQQAVFQATHRVARPLLSYEQRQLINDLGGRFGGKNQVKLLLEAYV
jgi:DNA helicase II / ATP-dependent DNA helicase PcrA